MFEVCVLHIYKRAESRPFKGCAGRTGGTPEEFDQWLWLWF